MTGGTVLCIDPDEAERSTTCRALRERTDLSVVGCDSLATAKGSLVDSVGCVVTEYELPDGTGIDLVEHAREVAPDTACVLYTTVDPDDIDTSEAGAAIMEYLQKGGDGDRDALVGLVNHVVSFRTQTAYPLPEDEAERLDALAQYTDDPQALEASLDRLTEIAGALFDVPMAMVGIMDEHEQRFISCYGMPSGDSVDREDTVCTYAMLEEDVTVIEDLLEDPRFEDNPGIREVGFRFYASADITTPDGHDLGTFCLYDDEPRGLDEGERALLQKLADEAMDQLQLRRLAAGGGSGG